jgi:hypothetical protein
MVRRLQTRLDAKDKRIVELERVLRGVLAIVSESEGVAGWHLNGAIATWEELGYPAEIAAVLAPTPPSAAGTEGDKERVKRVTAINLVREGGENDPLAYAVLKIQLGRGTPFIEVCRELISNNFDHTVYEGYWRPEVFRKWEGS